MLGAFHPVLHPGVKERALATRLPRFKDSLYWVAPVFSSLCSRGQFDSPLETTKSPRPCGVFMYVRANLCFLFWYPFFLT